MIQHDEPSKLDW